MSVSMPSVMYIFVNLLKQGRGCLGVKDCKVQVLQSNSKRLKERPTTNTTQPATITSTSKRCSIYTKLTLTYQRARLVILIS